MQTKELQGLHCRCLLIVPFWNWNFFILNDTLLKEGLLIVPFWNWNNGYLDMIVEPGKLLIVPFWNWNMYRRGYPTPPGLLLIVPFWNWNITTEPIPEVERMPFNRTILELKFGIVIAFTNRGSLLIVPFWNWNGVRVRTYGRSLCF